jgi:hypothetical protein
MPRSSCRDRARRSVLAALTATSLAACCASCDDPPVADPPATAPVAARAPAPLPPASPGLSRPPPFTRGRLDTLAVLLPSRPTSLTVTPGGKIYFCQATDERRDVVLTIGQREVPEPTALTSSTIADALGDPLINGNITSLSSARDGKLWYFFRGTVGEGRAARTVLAVGDYDPISTRVRVFADYDRLNAAAGFGAAMELADGDVACGRDVCWIWLRHLDGSALLSIDLSRLGGRTGFADLARPFPAVRYGSETLAMNRSEYRLSSAGDDSDDLLLVDAYTGGLFRIDPLGRADLISVLIGLPLELSNAAAMPAPNQGRTLLFASEAPPIEPVVAGRIDAPSVDTTYPAFLIFEKDQRIAAIAHHQLSGRPGLPVYAMRIESLVAERGGTYLAFDSANGELMRVRLHN